MPTRLLLGAIAGFVATLPMTAAMRSVHRRLPEKERYPAPPRELIDSAAQAAGVRPGDDAARDLTLAAHFAYGAATGALVAAALPRPNAVNGAAAGVAVWAASYLGWIPAARLLTPATAHPARRTLMMIGVHVVWGAGTALTVRELAADRETLIRAGPDRDIRQEDRA